MNLRNVTLSVFAAFLFGALTWTGYYILDVTEMNPKEEALVDPISGTPKVIFGFHLALWMFAGMAANYLWDLFRSGRSWQDITWRGVTIPFLVSPIVFYAIWSIWKGEKIDYTFTLIAFQNGFFWLAIFSKGAPSNRKEDER